MALIRIGFIGLSASGGWAGSAHWPYLKQTDKYTVTALLNSSIDSAKKARSHFELPESTKLYDSAEKLAEDPEIDLIVCSIRVNLHYDAIKPVLKAKKTVYCEWPLGANVTEAEELAQLAKENSPKSMIGLQTRQDPVIHKVKTLLEQNTIGRVLSSNLMAAAGLWGATHGAETSYFNDPKVGGNLLSIAFGHTVDYAMFTLGELKDLAGRVSVQRPQVDFMKDGKKVETADRKTPDQIMLQGQLQLGGVVSVHMRGGAPFKGEPGLTWRIYGERGEIQITAPGPFLQLGHSDVNIKLHDHDKNEVQDIKWDWTDGAITSALPGTAKHVGRMYEAFATGQGYPQFNVALRRHKMLAGLQSSSDSRQFTSY